MSGASFIAGNIIGPVTGSFVNTHRAAIFDVFGFQVPGYGIPFFVNAALGLLTTTMIMLFIKEPEESEKAPQFAVAPEG